MVAVRRSTEEKQSDAWLECSATQHVTATMILKNVNTFFAALWMQNPMILTLRAAKIHAKTQLLEVTVKGDTTDCDKCVTLSVSPEMCLLISYLKENLRNCLYSKVVQ